MKGNISHELQDGLRNRIDNELIGFFRTNLKREISYINKAITQMLGFDTPEDLSIEHGALKNSQVLIEGNP